MNKYEDILDDDHFDWDGKLMPAMSLTEYNLKQHIKDCENEFLMFFENFYAISKQPEYSQSGSTEFDRGCLATIQYALDCLGYGTYEPIPKAQKRFYSHNRKA